MRTNLSVLPKAPCEENISVEYKYDSILRRVHPNVKCEASIETSDGKVDLRCSYKVFGTKDLSERSAIAAAVYDNDVRAHRLEDWRILTQRLFEFRTLRPGNDRLNT